MLSDHLNDGLKDALLSGKKRIAFLIINGEYTWLIDWEEHFNLDQQKNIDAVCSHVDLMKYLPAGVTISEHKRKLETNFRAGFTVLGRSNIHQYLSGKGPVTVSTNEMGKLFSDYPLSSIAAMGNAVEDLISFGQPLPEEEKTLARNLSSLLPSFYINFDRKIFMHMRKDRFFEKSVSDDWYGAMGDFEHMVPLRERYWVISPAIDVWAITNIGLT